MSQTKKYIAGIVSMGLIAYATIFYNTFVWDDKGYVFSSPFTRPLYALKDILISKGEAGYRPLFYLYLNIVSILSQGNAVIIHLIQLGLHIGSAVLLFFLFKKFMRASVSLCLATLFVIHPITTETVTYMSAVGYVLTFFLGILALRRRSGFLLLLALLTNEAGAVWVLIALSYLWLFKKWKIPQVFALIAPPLTVYGFLRLFISKASFHAFSYVPIAQADFAVRLLTMPKILSYYFTTILYPAHLSIAQHWLVNAFTFQDVVIPLVIDITFIAAGVAGGVYLSRRHQALVRPYIFFALWFVFGMLPYLQIVPLDMTVADRWFYLPFAGLLGMSGVLVQTIKFSRSGKVVGVALVSILILSLSFRTVVRNANWKDGLMLFTHDVQDNPASFDIHVKLASELMSAKRYDEAMAHAQTAVRLNSDDISSLGTLALLYLQAGKPQQAIGYLQKLVHLDPTNYLGLTNLIYAYLETNDIANAKTYTLKGLALYPQDQSLLTFLSMTEKRSTPLPQR